MPIPTITHLQFFILDTLGPRDYICGHYRGEDLRSKIKAAGVRMSSAAFYQIMSRLEKASLVSGLYAKKGHSGPKIRVYKITKAGIKARDAAIQFYVNGLPARP